MKKSFFFFFFSIKREVKQTIFYVMDISIYVIEYFSLPVTARTVAVILISYSNYSWVTGTLEGLDLSLFFPMLVVAIKAGILEPSFINIFVSVHRGEVSSSSPRVQSEQDLPWITWK